MVVLEDGATIRVKSKFLAGRWDGDGVRFGDYDDIVVRAEGGWRIERRVCSLRDDGAGSEGGGHDER